MHPVGFQPTISAGDRPQTYAVDRATTGTGPTRFNVQKFCILPTVYLRVFLMDFKLNSDYFCVRF